MAVETTARILVVSHEARRTGAPRVAVEILRSLRKPAPSATEVVCLLRAPRGPLRDDLAGAADRLAVEPLPRVRAALRRWAPLRRAVDRVDELVAWAILRRTRPALAYLNTVKSACYVRPALRLGVPVLLHVHETGALAESTLRRFPVGRRWSEVRLVACSTAARDGLAPLVGVPAERIEVIHSPVDARAVSEAGGVAGPAPSDTADGGFVVGACGSVDRRKGTDLWFQVARGVRELRPGLDVRFRWVGRQKGPWPGDLAVRTGVDDMVDMAGETADPYPQLARMDVFTLTSRDDPFPLVVLEAMALGRPVVAFDVGGVREQLGDAGVVVPAGDTGAMAEAVVALLDDPVARDELGVRAAARARDLWDVGPFRQSVAHAVERALVPGDRAVPAP
jgi:glycosyltransferase involved in cell wall biosynthesis